MEPIDGESWGGDGPERPASPKLQNPNRPPSQIGTGEDKPPELRAVQASPAELVQIELLLANCEGAKPDGAAGERRGRMAGFRLAGAILLFLGIGGGLAGCRLPQGAQHPQYCEHQSPRVPLPSRPVSGVRRKAVTGRDEPLSDEVPSGEMDPAPVFHSDWCLHRRLDGRCRKFDGRCRRLPFPSPPGAVGMAGPRSATAAFRERAGPRYVIRKGLGGWYLVFDGEETVLPDDKAVYYAAHLLLHPPEAPLHASRLANEVFGHALIQQRNLGLDDQETTARQAEIFHRCAAILEDDSASALEKAEAQRELDEVQAWAKRHQRGVEAGEQKQVRSISTGLRRLIEELEQATGRRREPLPVLRAFGRHLRTYLWEASCRTSGRAGRPGRAGSFIYQPPEGVRWVE